MIPIIRAWQLLKRVVFKMNLQGREAFLVQLENKCMGSVH